MNLGNLPSPIELEAFIGSCIAEFASNSTRQVPLENVRDFEMTFGICVQTVRYAEAYLVLCKQGLSLEARAVARASLEHAATVEYAYFRRGGLDELKQSAEHAEWSLNDRLHQWTGNADYDPGPKPHAGPRLAPLTRGDGSGIFRQLDPDAEVLDPGYAILSQGVHVTGETVTGFFRKASAEGRGLQIDHRREDKLANYTRLLVAEACMLVSYIYAHLSHDRSRLKELEFRAEQLRIPMRLDLGWPEDSRSRRANY